MKLDAIIFLASCGFLLTFWTGVLVGKNEGSPTANQGAFWTTVGPAVLILASLVRLLNAAFLIP